LQNNGDARDFPSAWNGTRFPSQAWCCCNKAPFESGGHAGNVNQRQEPFKVFCSLSTVRSWPARCQDSARLLGKMIEWAKAAMGAYQGKHSLTGCLITTSSAESGQDCFRHVGSDSIWILKPTLRTWDREKTGTAAFDPGTVVSKAGYMLTHGRRPASWRHAGAST